MLFAFAVDIGIEQDTVIIGVISVMFAGGLNLAIAVNRRNTARTSSRKSAILADLTYGLVIDGRYDHFPLSSRNRNMLQHYSTVRLYPNYGSKETRIVIFGGYQAILRH
jgi:hypothetical protein